MPVPPLEISAAREDAGKKRYLAQKEERASKKDEPLFDMTDSSQNVNVSLLSQLVLPGDCNSLNIAQGGVIMKLMDNCAAVAAVRHCKTNIVTASLDALDFSNPIFLGNIVHVAAYPTFSSSKSMELEVHVDGEDITTGERWRSVSARLTFVSLGKDGKVKNIAPLNPKTDDEKRRFQAGKERYEKRKEERKRKKEARQ